MSKDTKKRDFKEALIQRIEALRELPDRERGLQISDIVDDLLSSRVSVTCEVAERRGCPVPDYNPATDGDYSQHLVSHNID